MIAITQAGRNTMTGIPSPRVPPRGLSYTGQARDRVCWIGGLTARAVADRQRLADFRAADRRSPVLPRRTHEEAEAITILEPRPRDHPHAVGARPRARGRRPHAQRADHLLPLRPDPPLRSPVGPISPPLLR